MTLIQLRLLACTLSQSFMLTPWVVLHRCLWVICCPLSVLSAIQLLTGKLQMPRLLCTATTASLVCRQQALQLAGTSLSAHSCDVLKCFAVTGCWHAWSIDWRCCKCTCFLLTALTLLCTPDRCMALLGVWCRRRQAVAPPQRTGKQTCVRQKLRQT